MAGPPLYRQIADQLRRQIDSGDLKAGMQIPTEDQLMEQYHASRNTVRGALRELTTRGLVDTRHGRGTYVLERVAPIVITLTSDPGTGRGGGEGLVYTAEVKASGRLPEMQPPKVRIEKAELATARSLQISEGDDVIVRHQNGEVDKVAWSLQTSYYPRSLEARAPRLTATGDIGEGAVGYLAELGIKQDGYQDSLEWRAPDEAETAYFQLPADGHVQVVELRRIAFDQNGDPFRLTVTIYRADRNRFVVYDGNVPRSVMHPE
jgi:GntR family transcriptional regulator